MEIINNNQKAFLPANELETKIYFEFDFHKPFDFCKHFNFSKFIKWCNKKYKKILILNFNDSKRKNNTVLLVTKQIDKQQKRNNKIDALFTIVAETVIYETNININPSDYYEKNLSNFNIINDLHTKLITTGNQRLKNLKIILKLLKMVEEESKWKINIIFSEITRDWSSKNFDLNFVEFYHLNLYYDIKTHEKNITLLLTLQKKLC